jgi:N-methylhydantoinase A/oxoprolinase/acetone carboxylase beta subunit
MEPKVEIGLREIYDAVVELKAIVSGHPDKLADHEDRIRKLEKKIWFVSGIASVVTVVISLLVNLLLK